MYFLCYCYFLRWGEGEIETGTIIFKSWARKEIFLIFCQSSELALNFFEFLSLNHAFIFIISSFSTLSKISQMKVLRCMKLSCESAQFPVHWERHILKSQSRFLIKNVVGIMARDEFIWFSKKLGHFSKSYDVIHQRKNKHLKFWETFYFLLCSCAFSCNWNKSIKNPEEQKNY